MSDLTRRAALASAAAALGSLAGCLSEPDDCSPATFPPENSTETRSGPPSGCQFGAELEQRGMDVDSVMSSGPGVSVMYFHNPERHREQIRTVALAFIPYRRMVDPDAPLSFTALSSNEDRHGNGYVAREWADRRARGELSESEYVQKVVDTYATR